MNIADIAQQLTLKLNSPILPTDDQPFTDQPFSLTGDELNFGPDAWAWLFLRLNNEYATAYSAISQNPIDENLAVHLLNKIEILNIRPDIDGSCGRRFGLSAWLDPALKKLPALRCHGSWFFPLKRPVPAAPFLPQSITQPNFGEHPLKVEAFPSPSLLAHESPFGFQAMRNAPPLADDRQAFFMSRRSWILTAVNCSVPPTAQVSALVDLVKIKRKYLMSQGIKTDDHQRSLILRKLTDCNFLSSEIHEHTDDKTDKATHPREFDEFPAKWRVVAIDALGPVVIQSKALLTLLADAYKSCFADGHSSPQPIPGPFPITLPTCKKYGPEHNGGNYLKALLTVAELNQLIGTGGGHPDSRRIMAAIPARLSSWVPAKAWRQDFQENLESKYVPQAQNLIDGGYKWLVHAQKPKPSALGSLAGSPLPPSKSSASEW